jgi:hypothetical protein
MPYSMTDEVLDYSAPRSSAWFAPIPGISCEGFWDRLRHRIVNSQGSKLGKPAITFGIWEHSSTPRAIVNGERRAASIVNDDSIFIKPWFIDDQRIGTGKDVCVPVTAMCDLDVHRLAAMLSSISHVDLYNQAAQRSLCCFNMQALYTMRSMMATAQRAAVQRRAFEIGTPADTKSPAKMRPISGRKARPLQRRVRPSPINRAVESMPLCSAQNLFRYDFTRCDHLKLCSLQRIRRITNSQRTNTDCYRCRGSRLLCAYSETSEQFSMLVYPRWYLI